LGQEQSKVSWIYVAIAAILSLFGIPTAYIFGISVLFSDGIKVLLDSEFYSREISNFLLFLVGVSALGRFVSALVWTIWVDVSKTSLFLAKTMLGRVWRAFMYSFFLISTAFTAISCLKILLDGRLILSLTAWCFLMLALGYLLYDFGFSRNRITNYTFKDYMRRSCDIRLYIADPYLLSVNIWIAVTISGGLGYHRGISLSLVHPTCIRLENEVIKAAIVGQTETGVVIAQVTPR
jgi:hypothetical protein